MELEWKRNKRSFKERFVDSYPFKFVTTVNEAPINVELNVEQDENTVSCIWDASIVLSHYLLNTETFPTNFFKGKNVIELGSGCGLSGLVGSFLGANTILTDLGDVIPLLQKNVTQSLGKYQDSIPVKATVEDLFWGTDVSTLKRAIKPEDPENAFDYILGADIIYELQGFDALITTLCDLCGPSTEILMAYEHRWSDVEKWFHEDATKHFTIQQIPRSEMHPLYSADNIYIYKLRKIKA